MEDEWEEEEQLVVVELSGVINNDYLSNCRGTCKILDIDSDTPMMQVGQYLFVGEYEDALGTCVLFEEKSADGDTKETTTDLKYNCHTVKRLKMQRIFLTEKKDEESSAGLGQKEVIDGVMDQDSLRVEQQGNSADDPQGNSAENQQGNSAEDQQGNSAEKQPGNSAEKQQGNSSDDPQGNSADDPQGNSADDPQGNSADDPQGNSADDPQGNSADDPQGNSADDPQGTVQKSHMGTVQMTNRETVQKSNMGTVQMTNRETVLKINMGTVQMTNRGTVQTTPWWNDHGHAVHAH
ncbi:hypothetical protein NHX12_002521 [Muraenolepis orangiensis]|uniref:Transcription factor TFIIIC triple barrel domain-containing protein n=1 Tax=Muraenolepis orangiensis TaxID=630683 RepID=A0A9Q0ID45_9TELE|nr:hypothetical protein NHX12_002521 [Muraenolepis orangiensis]